MGVTDIEFYFIGHSEFFKGYPKKRIILPTIDFSEAKFPLKSNPCQRLKNLNRVVSFAGICIFDYVFPKCCKLILKNLLINLKI